MCFSANASFIVGTGLAAAGTVAIGKVRDPKHYLFAAIPIFFSLQQYTEGFLWLSFTSGTFIPYHRMFTSLFLFFAQVLWPLWVPLSFMMLEKEEQRKKILRTLSRIGLFVSIFLGVRLLVYPFHAEMANHHVHYVFSFPKWLVYLSSALYVIPTLLPPFLCSAKYTRALAAANLGSFLLTKFFWGEYVISVWCFFGAVISILIVLILSQIKNEKEIQLP